MTIYLTVAAIQAVLSFVAAESGPRSSILFDYATRAFAEGDHRSYGARQLAYSFRRFRIPKPTGLGDIASFIAPHGLALRSDVDADELERRYLTSLPGPSVKALGCQRIAHVARA